MTWKIEQAELIEWLQSYDGQRFHAILSDPPYALISITKRFGKEGSAAAQEGSDGRYSRLSKGFMGTKWDGFASLEHYEQWVSEWAQLLIEKALYPGAVCLFFGGTRTFHHLGVGLERGGFEIVDTLMYLHGQGFPKGHSQSAALWKEVLSCQLNASANLVVQDSPFIPLPSNEDGGITALAYARILPAGDLALLIQIGEAEVSCVLMAISLSESSNPMVDMLTGLNMTSLWKEESGVGYSAVNKSIIGTATNRITGQRILSFLRSLNTPDFMPAAAILANGQPWFAGNVAMNLKGEKTNWSAIPMLTVLGNVTENPVRGWAGHNLALKPAYEPIFLCRAPRQGKTFAQLAVEYGSGALNIDGARIGLAGIDDANHRQSAWSDHQKSQTFHGQEYRDLSAVEAPTGRWPANLLLSHADDCVMVGEYEVEARVINRWKSGMKPFGDAAGEEYETVRPGETQARIEDGTANPDYERPDEESPWKMPPGRRRDKDTEMVERYACVPECPVRQLDDQVGERTSGFAEVLHRTSDKGYSGWPYPQDEIDATYGDSGGVSRFFYTSKAARAEKDKGLEDFYWKRTDDGFERIEREEYDKLPRRERAHGCIHPTVKPLDLCRYLATLMLPPKQEGTKRHILVPFSGSGSEMIGAHEAGWDEVIGVEMEDRYNTMADARLTANLGLLGLI